MKCDLLRNKGSEKDEAIGSVSKWIDYVFISLAVNMLLSANKLQYFPTNWGELTYQCCTQYVQIRYTIS